MEFCGNGIRYQRPVEGRIPVNTLGFYHYKVNAWVDHFKSWHRDILKKIEAEVEYSVDLNWC
jgi:starch synthase (maltosyl-transferring)